MLFFKFINNILECETGACIWIVCIYNTVHSTHTEPNHPNRVFNLWLPFLFHPIIKWRFDWYKWRMLAYLHNRSKQLNDFIQLNCSFSLSFSLILAARALIIISFGVDYLLLCYSKSAETLQHSEYIASRHRHLCGVWWMVLDCLLLLRFFLFQTVTWCLCCGPVASTY